MPLTHMLDLAQQAVRRAGDHARSQFGQTSAQLKSVDQLVTQADLQCQAIIIEHIARQYPQHGFIGEEGDNGGLFKQCPSDPQDTWWVIDPIDGTTNFAHGLPQYSISLGMIVNGHPQLGVIYDPSTNMIFAGGINQPATCNGRSITCLEEELHPNSQFAIPSRFPGGIPGWLPELFEKYVVRNFGSAALHFAYVALGGLTATFAWDIKLWDFAAGAAIAQAAGAIVTDMNDQPRFPIDCAAYNGEPLSVFVGGNTVRCRLGSTIFSGNDR